MWDLVELEERAQVYVSPQAVCCPANFLPSVEVGCLAGHGAKDHAAEAMGLGELVDRNETGSGSEKVHPDPSAQLLVQSEA